MAYCSHFLFFVMATEHLLYNSICPFVHSMIFLLYYLWMLSSLFFLHLLNLLNWVNKLQKIINSLLSYFLLIWSDIESKDKIIFPTESTENVNKEIYKTNINGQITKLEPLQYYPLRFPQQQTSIKYLQRCLMIINVLSFYFLDKEIYHFFS